MKLLLSKSRLWLILIVVLVAAGAAAYFAGSTVERSARVRDAAVYQGQYAAVETQLHDARSQVAGLQSINRLLSADLWTYRAAAALDNRNFGVANDAVANVLTNLNRVDTTTMGLNNSTLAALKREAAGINVSVATNLESQRTQLLRLAADINAMITQSVSTSTAPVPSESASPAH